MAVCGYLDKWAYLPGDKASLRVDSDDQAYSVDLISIDSPQDALANIGQVGRFPGSRQRSTVGSMIYVPSTGPELLTRASIRLWIWPTLPERGTQQVLLSWRDQTDEGLTLAIDSDGRLYGRASVANVEWKTSLNAAVRAKTWYHVFVGLDAAAGRLAVLSSELDGRVLDRSVITHRASDETTSVRIDGPITIGAIGIVDNAGKYSIDKCYDGKIEQPAIYREWPDSPTEKAWQSFDFPPDAVVGRWDLAQVHGTTKVPDSGAGERHGSTVNLPALRMKGHGWSWRQSPAEQALNRNAIHFHHDDVGERQWDVSTIVQLPEDLETGAYAVRVDDGSNFAELPFFIRARDTDRPEIAVLLPTFTYLAYGNLRPDVSNPEAVAIEKAHRDLGLNAYDESNAIDTFLAQRPDLGASLYNRHADGSGVCYATRLRPVMTFSSDYHWWGTGGPRHLSTDILLLRWLRSEGHRFDIITDEDVDTCGAGLLASYKVVITGSHPEYVSAKWLSALEDWLSDDGRLMYLGGNGLYWVTATTPDMPGVVEIRRGWAGSRDWESEPGEEWLSLEDGVGGLWRHRGIPPQRLVGVGFTAMGWGSSAGYARCAESFDDDVAFVFEGIGDDEIIGGFDSGLGSALTGAAGDEIDRADFALGTPLETKVLATSSGRHGRFQRSIEDLAQFSHHFGSAQDPDVRADMVLIDRQNGGCVFSVGSMNWIPFLAAGDGDNNVTTVTRNVLNNFLSRPEKNEG